MNICIYAEAKLPGRCSVGELDNCRPYIRAHLTNPRQPCAISLSYFHTLMSYYTFIHREHNYDEVTMNRYATFFFLAICMICSSQLSAQPTTGAFSLSFENNGITSTISCYVPEDYDSTETYPFLYAWHGGGMQARHMRDMLYLVIARDLKVIVYCPDWNNIQSQQQFTLLKEASLAHARHYYSLDPDRFIATGFSIGGVTAYQLALNYPTLFTGVIGLSPAIDVMLFSETMWNNIGRVRMATILGDQDDNFTGVDVLMQDIRSRGGSLLYLIKPGVEHQDETYYNSPEFKNDYRACYNYVLGVTSVEPAALPEGMDITMFPSPVSNSMQLSITTDQAMDLSAELYAFDGSLLWQSCTVTQGNSLTQSVDMSFLPSGTYVAVIRYGDEICTRKVLKVR